MLTVYVVCIFIRDIFTMTSAIKAKSMYRVQYVEKYATLLALRALSYAFYCSNISYV